jgi:hypothetical protein
VKDEAAGQRISKVAKKSIATSVDLSNSRDYLPLENERLLARTTDLRGALVELEGKETPETILQTAETITVPQRIDISDKLNNCEDTVADLDREQIDASHKGLESMSF